MTSPLCVPHACTLNLNHVPYPVCTVQCENVLLASKGEKGGRARSMVAKVCGV